MLLMIFLTISLFYFQGHIWPVKGLCPGMTLSVRLINSQDEEREALWPLNALGCLFHSSLVG